MASARTFNLKITQKSGPEHTFTSITREEPEGIETFLKVKKVCMMNDMMDSETIMTIPLNTDQDQTKALNESRVKQVLPRYTHNPTHGLQVVLPKFGSEISSNLNQT